MFSNLKLSTKFTLLLSIVFIGGIIISGFTLWQVLHGRAQAEITSQGLMLIEAMNSVRSYTSNNIRPLLADDLERDSEFIAESVPAFSAGAVFERFRQGEEHANFFYKEAALNPTNPHHRADTFEASLVERMRSDRTIREVSDFRDMDGERVFYIARPLAVTAESCLYCHSAPELAPASLIATYGSENGFGWQLNEIIAAQIIYVPAEEVFNATLRSFTLIMAIFITILALVLVMINVLLRQYVIEPIGLMGALAQKISADEMVPEDMASEGFIRVTQRADELGHLAHLFQRMAQEVYTRTQNLKREVLKLRVEVDEIKRQEQVSEITSSDFFQELQAKARQMRQQHSSNDESEGE